MNIERHILKCLVDCGGFLLPESTLHAELNIQLPQPLTLSDLKAHLAALEARHQVTGITTDDGIRWKIAPEGKARLAQ